jgi:flagellar hook assembly protein FlgD
MKTTTLCVMMMGAAFVMRAGAGESQAPEQLGAHWARVSDEAKVQLIVDGLRSIGGGTGVVVRKHASALLRVNLADAVAASLAKSHSSNGSVPTLAAAGKTHASHYDIKVHGATASVEFSSGERLSLEQRDGVWSVTGGSLPKNFFTATNDETATSTLAARSGVSVGESFTEQAVSRERRISRLTQGVTRSQIERQLFSVPGKTASYYSVLYRRGLSAPIATYVQFVLDAEWNRIVYGNMNNWIKSYNVHAPSAIVVDADGNVFVGEPARKRVLVLKLVGSATLQLQSTIPNIENPSELAINDNGTPFNTSDDFLYVADPTRNKIFKYTAGGTAHALVATFDGFDTPTSIAVGRWNGANNRVLYVVDKIGKRVRAFDDERASLSLLAQHRGDYSQYFTSIKTDHFGHVYVVDNVNSKVMKFTSQLELLDEHGGADAFAALNSVDIPFARIEIDGERRWVGFDQMFALERWDNTSGVQRRKFGIKLRNIDFRADQDVSSVANAFVLTDVANVAAKIFDERNRLVRTLSSSWLTAGAKNLHWDRRSDEGVQVPAGTYRYELMAVSAYAGEPTISNTRFYLPLYYAEDCGSENRNDDAHLVRGSVVRWGNAPSQTANEDESSVQYRFTGLNPAGEYEVAAEFVANDALQRLQELTANGKRLLEPQRVSTEPTQTGFVRIPKELYVNGEVTIAVNKLGEGSAIATQLWIKEVGKGFNPEPMQTLPTKYALDQNYPNPFNPTTTIRYAIPDDGLVTLKVYNIAGQEVATLVNEAKKAGKYEVIFDARNTRGGALASGVYFYRLVSASTSGSTRGFAETKKFALVK